jgi:hypothetical protein
VCSLQFASGLSHCVDWGVQRIFGSVFRTVISQRSCHGTAYRLFDRRGIQQAAIRVE